MCQAVLDACEKSGMTSRGIVYVDETVDEYRNIRLPRNWSIHYEPKWGSLQASMQYVFNKYPDAKSYGWLADDTYPLTEGWDKKVEAAAGDWALAYCNDLWIGPNQRDNGIDLTAGLCWGGELVRTVGWWALPGVQQAGIDTAWTLLLKPLQLLRYLPEVVVEHKNYRTLKREKDWVDSWERAGVDYVNADISVRDKWAVSPDCRRTARRIAEALGLEGSIRWDRDYPIHTSTPRPLEQNQDYVRPARAGF